MHHSFTYVELLMNINLISLLSDELLGEQNVC